MLVWGCSSDYGVVTVEKQEVVQEIIEQVTVVEEIEVVGDIVVEGGYIYNQTLDILFLIDESGSMNLDQEALWATMPLIYAELVGSSFTDLQWQAGIGAIDDSAGGIYGFVTWENPNAEWDLAALMVLLQQHPFEEGRDAAIYSMANDDDFHRPDADLLIVFISDEPDQSQTTIEQYEIMVSSYKEYPFIVTESSIVSTGIYEWDEEICTQNALGEGYLDISEVVVDICDTDQWVTVLDHAKEHVPTLNEKWPLDQVPLYPDEIIVQADGAVWSEWEYVIEENTIYLTSIPPIGTYITIAYLVEGGDGV